MAERINGSGLPSLSHLDAATADPTAAAQQLGIAKNMAPVQAAPLQPVGQSTRIASIVINPELTRIAPPLAYLSVSKAQAHLTQVSKRISTPVENPGRYAAYLEREGRARPILDAHLERSRQISERVTHGRT